MEKTNLITCIYCKSKFNKNYINRHQQTKKCKYIQYQINKEKIYINEIEDEYYLIQELQQKEYNERKSQNNNAFNSNLLTQSIFGNAKKTNSKSSYCVAIDSDSDDE